jgi:hypothetical protein
MKIQPHQGTAKVSGTFAEVAGFASANAGLDLRTSARTGFTALVGESKGRKVIRFFQRGREYARAYECCWGRYYNCNRTRIGMYCEALDAAAGEWFARKIAELKTELERLPAHRQEQLTRKLEGGQE